jgi:hypothetical protein
MIKPWIVPLLFISLSCLDSLTHKCDQTETCKNQDDCPEFLKKKRDFRRTYKVGQSGYKEALTEIKGWVCNKNEKSVCCPSTNSCEEEVSSCWLPKKGECGLSPNGTLSRVFGGEATTPGQFPFTALLGYPDTRKIEGREEKQTVYGCGGVLINHWYVVTAAHCQGKSPNPQISTVRLGEWEVGHDPDCISIDGTTNNCLNAAQDFLIRAEQVTIHEDYGRTSAGNIVNDIALVKLDKPAVLNNGVQIVCLPLDKEEAARELNLPDLAGGLTGTFLTVVGWGYTEYNPYVSSLQQGDFKNSNVASSVQQMLNVPVLSFEECKEKWGGYLEMEETQICAGGEKGKDSCKVIIFY